MLVARVAVASIAVQSTEYRVRITGWFDVARGDIHDSSFINGTGIPSVGHRSVGDGGYTRLASGEISSFAQRGVAGDPMMVLSVSDRGYRGDWISGGAVTCEHGDNSGLAEPCPVSVNPRLKLSTEGINRRRTPLRL